MRSRPLFYILLIVTFAISGMTGYYLFETEDVFPKQELFLPDNTKAFLYTNEFSTFQSIPSIEGNKQYSALKGILDPQDAIAFGIADTVPYFVIRKKDVQGKDLPNHQENKGFIYLANQPLSFSNKLRYNLKKNANDKLFDGLFLQQDSLVSFNVLFNNNSFTIGYSEAITTPYETQIPSSFLKEGQSYTATPTELLSVANDAYAGFESVAYFTQLPDTVIVLFDPEYRAEEYAQDTNTFLYTNFKIQPSTFPGMKFQSSVNDFTLFANKLSQIQGLVDGLTSGQNLSTNESLESWRIENIENPTTYIQFYTNNNPVLELIFGAEEMFTRQVSQVNKGQLVHSLLISSDADLAPQNTEEQNTSKIVKLAGRPVLKPLVFRSHLGPQKFIFTQDQIGVAYLLNSKGEIRWKRDLTDPVIGTPQLIDLYNNNKTQLLVTTRKAIHVIDINGNSPKGFPIQLNETTEIEASFFDYDNDGKIRILVPLSSGIVANYNKDGQAVKGWKFTEGVASPSTPIKHFKLGTTDYITHTSKDGTILLYNRKGNLKSNPFKLGNYAGGTVFVFPSGNSIDRTKFIYRSKSNRLYSQTYKHKPDSLNFTHDLLEIYDYKDADGDGTKDIVGRTSSGIATFSSSGIVMTEFKTSLIPEMEPTLLHFSAAKNYVGLLSEGKVYFLNAFGEVVKGFPISGESVFSVSNLRGGNSFYLITGKGNNLIIEELGM